MNGFLNILKPPGMSSGGVVSKFKYLTGERTGHAGTLDPEAAGVLPIMIGRATRLLDYLPDDKKVYVCEIAFSGATTTQDAQGKIVEEGRGVPEQKELEEILPSFIGNVLQRPPIYSALKRDGVALYKLARRGAEVELDKRNVMIRSIELLGKGEKDSYRLRICCGRGTYIRTLCHDIGQALGCPAHMRFLLRTASAGLSIKDSHLIEEFETPLDAEKALIPMDSLLTHIPPFIVDPVYRVQAANGKAVPCNEEIRGPVRMYLDGIMIGIAEQRKMDGLLHFKVICADYHDFA